MPDSKPISEQNDDLIAFLDEIQEVYLDSNFESGARSVDEYNSCCFLMAELRKLVNARL